MKIIDLLNKIANGEEVPNKVRYDDEIYDTEISNNFSLMIYEATGKMSDDGEVRLFLNDEVEIIEEDKKIEKSDFQYSEIPPYFGLQQAIKSCNNNFEKHQKAINKILDYLMENKQ